MRLPTAVALYGAVPNHRANITLRPYTTTNTRSCSNNQGRRPWSSWKVTTPDDQMSIATRHVRSTDVFIVQFLHSVHTTSCSHACLGLSHTQDTRGRPGNLSGSPVQVCSAFELILRVLTITIICTIRRGVAGG